MENSWNKFLQKNKNKGLSMQQLSKQYKKSKKPSKKSKKTSCSSILLYKNKKIGYYDNKKGYVFQCKNKPNITIKNVEYETLKNMRKVADCLNIKNYMTMSKKYMKDYLSKNIKVREFVKN